MRLHGANGQIQGLCDLTVAQTTGRQLGDATLARRERFRPNRHRLRKALARRSELLVCTLGQRKRSAPPRQIQGLAQRDTCVGSFPRTPQHRAEICERARMFESGRRRLERFRRLAQESYPGLSSLRDSTGAQSDTDVPWRTPRACFAQSLERSFNRFTMLPEQNESIRSR